MKQLISLAWLQRVLSFKKIVVLLLIFSPTKVAAFSSGFDYPVGAPDGKGYYDAQDFGAWNPNFNGYHLGEDWNGNGGGDSDLGDPIYSISRGRVLEATYRRGWGNVALVAYTTNETEEVVALYGHFKEIYIKKGQDLSKGEKIGTVGKGDNNRFAAHLHFELRSNTKIGIGAGYGGLRPSGWIDPSEFIKSHRGSGGQMLTAVQNQNNVNLSWTKAEGLDKSIIYRSVVVGGTAEESKRTKIGEFFDPAVASTVDSSPPMETNVYYRIYTYFKNGLVSESEEICVATKRTVTKITNNSAAQTKPVIDGDFVYWTDARLENGRSTYKIFYYNLKTGQEGSIDVSSVNIETPENAAAVNGKVVFEGTGSILEGRNIYLYGQEGSGALPVTKATKDQTVPAISKEGVVVWQDMQNGSNLDVYYLDTANSLSTPTLFAGGVGNQRNPKIWNNHVVWKDSRAGNRYDLYIKEIGGAEELLEINVGDSAPDIWGEWVVWEYKGKITILDFETKARTVITETAGYNPKIRDGKVVYSKAEGTSSYIHVYNMDNYSDTKIDFAIKNNSNPFISGNLIAFDVLEPDTVADLNIYLTRL